MQLCIYYNFSFTLFERRKVKVGVMCPTSKICNDFWPVDDCLRAGNTYFSDIFISFCPGLKFLRVTLSFLFALALKFSCFCPCPHFPHVLPQDFALALALHFALLNGQNRGQGQGQKLGTKHEGNGGKGKNKGKIINY